MQTLSRRDLLRGSRAVGLACAVFPRRALAASLDALQGDAAYGGFNMGLQTYTLRAFDLDQTLVYLKDFGLKYASFFSGKQMQITDDKPTLELWKEKLKAAGVQILSYGVEGFSRDVGATKKKLEFARAMGFGVFSAVPSADSFASLASLTKDHGIKIAIHNHGPEDKTYGHLGQVQKAIEKWPETIGACVDTGHALRNGEDPLRWIRALGSRIHDVHLKDFSDAATEHTLGKGKLDVLGVLKALKDVKFSGILAVEYEKNEKDPIADVKECLAAVREAAKAI